MKKPIAILHSLFAIAALAAAQTSAIMVDRTDGSIEGPATIDWSAATSSTITWPSIFTLDTERDTTAEINAATTDDDFATLTGTQTLTNKTIFGTFVALAIFLDGDDYTDALRGGETWADTNNSFITPAAVNDRIETIALLDSEVSNLAALKAFNADAINADNITTGTLDDAYIDSSIARVSDLNGKADIAIVEGALAERRAPLIDGIYSDGTTEAIALPQDAALDVGTIDVFSWHLGTLVQVDWSPASQVTLMTNEDGNTGFRILLETDGTLTAEFGDGTDWDASYSIDESLANLPAYTPASIGISVDRDGLAYFYVDGIALGTVDISAAAAIDPDTSNDWEILPSSEGWVYGVPFFSTEFLSPADWHRYHLIPDSIRRDAGGYAYESDFSSAGLDNWSDVSNDTITSNVDSINGEDDWLSILKSTDTSVSGADRSTLIVSGVSYRVTAELFTPATSVVDNVRIRWLGVGPVLFFNMTPGSRTSANSTFTASATTSNLQVQPSDGGSYTFVGDGVDDILYIKNFRLLRLGMIAAWDLSEAGATKSDLIGSLDGTRGSNAEDAI